MHFVLLLLKFSLEGHPAIAALQTGAVAVWPSDEFMAFIKYSSSKCESRTDKFEKSIYSIDFWGSGNTDNETDSETDGDMALQKTVNCHPIQSENVAEIQRSLLQLHTERRIIELKAIEGTEKKYYENYLLHAKKSKNQEFKCGDEVWFHHPEKYGMVVVPNIQGRVKVISVSISFGCKQLFVMMPE